MNAKKENKLRTLRLSAGMKQSTLAELVGVKQNTISCYENGRIPNLQMALKIAAIFNKDVTEVFGDERT